MDSDSSSAAPQDAASEPEAEETSTYPDENSPPQQYWRRIAGNDLVHILKIHRYDEVAIDRFMRYFMQHIPRAWNFNSIMNSKDPDPTAPSLNLDGSPMGLALTFTADNPNPADRPPVRLLAEVDHLTAKRSLDEYCKRNMFGPIKYDMAWADSLYRSIMQGTDFTYFGDVRLGFDIRPGVRRSNQSLIMLPGPGALPADATAHFVATRKAQHEEITRWALIRQAILNLPHMDDDKYQRRNIRSGVTRVDEFLAEYPPEFGNLVSIVDIGPEAADQARIGFAFTIPAGETEADFEEVWKWLTLGGRIRKLSREIKDKNLTLTFFNLVYGATAHLASRKTGDEPPPPSIEPYLDRAGRAREGTLTKQVAPCSVYFCLAAETREPTATLVADVVCSTRTDFEIAQGFGWFLKHLKEQGLPGIGAYPNLYTSSLVPSLFPGLPLAQYPSLRLHTSVSFCLKEGAAQGGQCDDDWTLRAYYNPLYYHCVRP